MNASKLIFQDKTVLITGSSQGIGRQTAEAFLKKGAKVVINGRNAEKLARVARELEQYGAVFPIAADVSNWEECERLIAKSIERFQQLDILVCNAGLKFKSSFTETHPTVFSQILHNNLLGKIYPAKAALPEIIQKKGSIIFISSLAGLYGLPYSAAYSASKMGVRAIAESLQTELKDEGVHIGLLYIGFTENDEQATIMNGYGNMELIPDRGVTRQSKKEVASTLLQMVKNRQKRKVLTTLGHTLDWLARISPSMVQYILYKQLKKFKE